VQTGWQTDNRDRREVTGASQLLRLEGEASTARGRRALVCKLAATRTPGNTGPLELHGDLGHQSPCTRQKE
jgi:hypothetical protein